MARKIAIIGGGPAGMAAAFRLMNEGRTDDEITMYQMGWRTGGKCAAGRDRKTGRLHEHGLHVFAGFYHRAYSQLRLVYEDWKRYGTRPLPFLHALIPIDKCRFMEGAGRSIPLEFGRSDRERELDQSSLEPVELLAALVETAIDRFTRCSDHLPFPLRKLLSWSRSQDGFLVKEALRLLRKAMSERSDQDSQDEPSGQLQSQAAAKGLALALRPLRESLKLFVKLGIGDNKNRDETLVALLGIVVAIGLLEDDLLPHNFDKVNDQEASEWLRSHGADEALLNSAFIRASYDYTFAYKGGQTDKPVRWIAAGTALRGYLNLLFTYRGSLFNHLNGPMSETIFVPYYEVLRERGVRFAFFHRVDEIGLDSTGTRVEHISGVRQATPKKGEFDYDPLFSYRDRQSWPDEPKFELLEDGDKLRDWFKERNTTFESPYYGELPTEEPFSISRDDGAGFTHVILAVPPDVVKAIAKPLIEKNDEWASACAGAEQIPTIAVELRGTDPFGSQVEHSGLITAHVQPLSTWADMSFIQEDESGGERTHLSYLCGPWPKNSPNPGENWQDFSDREHAHARKVVAGWLAKHRETTLRIGMNRPKGPPAHPLPKIESVRVSLNIGPSDGYVLSPPKSIDTRLHAGKFYFENLLVAGDWTRTGLDAGCYESALMSGEDCAGAILE